MNKLVQWIFRLSATCLLLSFPVSAQQQESLAEIARKEVERHRNLAVKSRVWTEEDFSSPNRRLEFPNVGLRLAIPPDWVWLNKNSRFDLHRFLCPGAIELDDCSVLISHSQWTEDARRDFLDNMRSTFGKPDFREFEMLGLPATEVTAKLTPTPGVEFRYRYIEIHDRKNKRVYVIQFEGLAQLFETNSKSFDQLLATVEIIP